MSSSAWQESDRTFKVWEYQVSHAQLLVRSPRAPATPSSPAWDTNLDLVCVGVEYMALPHLMRGIRLSDATSTEVEAMSALLGKPVRPANVSMLVSGGRRFPVVAFTFSTSENDWEVFESPFEFRSQFRHRSSTG